MQIKEYYKKSLTSKVIKWFMGSQDSTTSADSWIIKITNLIKLQWLSEILLLLSTIAFCYKGFFDAIGLTFISKTSLASIFLFFSFVFIDKKRININRSIWYLLLFIFSMVLSGIIFTFKYGGTEMVFSGILLFLQFILALFIGESITNKRRFIEIICYLSMPMIAVGAYQFLSGQKTSALWLASSETGITTRSFAFFTSPNILGATLVFIIIMTLALFIKKRNYLLLFISFTAFIVLGFTFSRSAWLALLISFLVIALAYNWKILLASPLVSLFFLIPQIRNRFLNIFTNSYIVDSSIDGRIWSINNGLHIFSKNILLGTGPGTYGGLLAKSYSSPIYLEGIQGGYVSLYFTDNQWLQILVQTGIIGFLLLGLFFLNTGSYFLKKFINSHDFMYAGFMACVISFIVLGLFANIMEFGAVTVFSGAIIGMGMKYEE